MTHVTEYKIAGMTCEHCVRAVTEELSKIGGVEDVRVDLATASARVESSEPLPLDAVRAAVDEAGYELLA